MPFNPSSKNGLITLPVTCVKVSLMFDSIPDHDKACLAIKPPKRLFIPSITALIAVSASIAPRSLSFIASGIETPIFLANISQAGIPASVN